MLFWSLFFLSLLAIKNAIFFYQPRHLIEDFLLLSSYWKSCFNYKLSFLLKLTDHGSCLKKFNFWSIFPCMFNNLQMNITGIKLEKYKGSDLQATICWFWHETNIGEFSVNAAASRIFWIIWFCSGGGAG